ncbi:MAG: protein phosphatase 2C domain-containing protein [Pyrinomonadaceae bacterium]
MTNKNYQIESAAISDRGLSEKRPQNEDSFLELNKNGLFVVADGVGGAQAGDVASQMAVEILGEAFINLQKNSDAEDLMKLAIERANEAIFQMSHELAQLSTMATTIVALHIAGNIATIGHVGDSRLYRVDAKGNFFRETQDHSVVEEEVRAGRMTAEQAVNHPSRNVISRALGADQTVEVDLKTLMIEPNTTFLLCSDGITRHIDDFQLRELLIFKDTPESICQRMKEICYERGAEDNLTAVIAKVTDKIIETPVDLEEATVAAARPPATGEVSAAPLAADEEFATQPLTMPVGAEFQSPEVDSENKVSEPIQTAASNETSGEIKRETKIIPTDKKAVTGSSNKSFSPLFLLILGWVLGAGIIYLLTRNNQTPTEPPPLAQTTIIEYKAFEDGRREVDRQPENFIFNNAGKSQNAEQLYLLGRAYLLTGKFSEAKKSFEEAKNKLAMAGETNQRILGNEIAMGLAIIADPAAQTNFQNQIKTNGAETNGNTNSVQR